MVSGEIIILVAALVVTLVAVVYFVLRRRGGARASVGFGKSAAALGFKAEEIRLLNRVANDVAPDNPGDLLTSVEGRQLLLRSLERQLRRDQRRVEVGSQARDKLERMGEEEFQERTTERLETNLPVWVIEKTLSSDEDDEDEDLLTPSARVEGRLLDISKSGAALQASLAVQAGDVVEFWSADADVALPATTAGVVHVQARAQNEPQMLHLHFVNPLLAELGQALERIRQLHLPGRSGEK